MDPEIRPMRPEDVPAVVAVSLAADTVFADAGVRLPPDDPREMLGHVDRVLVAGDPARGLAATVLVDGRPHLEQLAVDPAHGRRGIGSALLEAVCAEAAGAGHREVTLTAFRDLPWNGPWYAHRGFVLLPGPEWGPELEELWAEEGRAGIRVLPRTAMVRALTASPPGGSV